MSAIDAWRRSVLLVSICTLLLVDSSLGQSVNFQVSDINASVAVATGRFTPTQYIPAFSSLVVTLAGLNVFPGDALSIGASVSVPDQSGNALRFELFRRRESDAAFTDVVYETALLDNELYKTNSPSERGWTSGINVTQSTPDIDQFGRRATGAFCPTLSGQYNFKLTDLDDYASLHIARQDPNSPGSILPFEEIINQIRNLSPEQYSGTVNKDYYMQAGKMYPLIVLFADGALYDYATFNWRKPGDAADSWSSIPSSAFCTGWSNFHGGVLNIFFPFFLLQNVEVTFTIQMLPNPSCPRSASAQVSSAILVPGPVTKETRNIMNSVSGTVQSSSSGSYPATFHGQSACKLGVVFSVNDTSAASSEVVGRFTPTQYIPAFSSLVVTLAGSNVFPAGASSDRARIRSC